jgi:hypothetical protein
MGPIERNRSWSCSARLAATETEARSRPLACVAPVDARTLREATMAEYGRRAGLGDL